MCEYLLRFNIQALVCSGIKELGIYFIQLTFSRFRFSCPRLEIQLIDRQLHLVEFH